MPDTERGEAFVRDVFGVTEISSASGLVTFPVAGREEEAAVRTRARIIGVEAPAHAFLTDDQGRVSGVKTTTGVYRAVYLPLRLNNFKPRQSASAGALTELLERGLRYLTREQMGPVALSSVSGPAPYVRIGPLRPEVAVMGEADAPPTRFLVGFEVAVGDSVVARFEKEEPALAPGAERVIALPEWTAKETGKFSIRVGVGWQDGELHYQPPRTVRVLDLPERFGRDEMPAATGAGFFDHDHDGDEDLYLVNRGGPNQLLSNDGGGGFADVAGEVGLADAGNGRGLAVADYDGDGDLDLYLVNEGANVLFANAPNEADGAGPAAGGSGRRFTDVTAAAGGQADHPLSDDQSGRSAGFFDGDGDGDLDLYVVNAAGPNRYFEQAGGLFREQGAATGLDDDGDGRALTFGDYDDDGDADLFVANQDGSVMLRRDSAGDAVAPSAVRYTEVLAESGIASASMDVGCVFGDYDNDGDLDLFVANESTDNRLYRNLGEGRFEEATGPHLALGGATVGSAWIDIDNDGDLDLAKTALSSGADEIYANQGNGELLPVGTLLELGSAVTGRALSHADVDGDGDEDLFVAHAMDSSALYRNSTQRSGRSWLHVALQTTDRNRQGLGAVVEVVSGATRQRRDLQPAFSYLSHGPATLHFGLGAAVSADSLRVRWPDGSQTVWTGVAANQRLLLAHPHATAVTDEVPAVPSSFRLGLGYPNPFNSVVVVPFYVPQRTAVRLEVFNVTGQRVRTLVDDALPAGVYRARWDRRNGQGQPAASGTYFVRLQAEGFLQVQRVMLLK